MLKVSRIYFAASVFAFFTVADTNAQTAVPTVVPATNSPGSEAFLGVPAPEEVPVSASFAPISPLPVVGSSSTNYPVGIAADIPLTAPANPNPVVIAPPRQVCGLTLAASESEVSISFGGTPLKERFHGFAGKPNFTCVEESAGKWSCEITSGNPAVIENKLKVTGLPGSPQQMCYTVTNFKDGKEAETVEDCVFLDAQCGAVGNASDATCRPSVLSVKSADALASVFTKYLEIILKWNKDRKSVPAETAKEIEAAVCKVVGCTDDPIPSFKVLFCKKESGEPSEYPCGVTLEDKSSSTFYVNTDFVAGSTIGACVNHEATIDGCVYPATRSTCLQNVNMCGKLVQLMRGFNDVVFYPNETCAKH